jgi:hypothetical protein
MKRQLRNIARSIPGLEQFLFLKGALQGHFYSPVPSLKEVRKRRTDIFGVQRPEIPGVDLHEPEQLLLLNHLAREFYREQPFSEDFLSNDAFRFSDAIFLYSMLRYSRPKRLVEVGSGYSSHVTLETNRRFLNNSVNCRFVEPYPSDFLKSAAGNAVIESPVQEAPFDIFSSLEAGDILFIDSSHVSKVGSDVNFIFFYILPILRSGVRIHFHDVFYPFEYPEEWILDGRAWNEDYLLRAFLQFNSEFRIELFPNYLMRFHQKFFESNMPMCLKDPGGSIWMIRK